MPFADYENFDECVRKNKDKKDPEAYCAEIKRKTEKEVSWEYGISFEKLEGSDPDVLYVAGEASNALKDHDNENMDMDSLKSAFVDYMKNPVIKFMHDKAPQHIGAIGLVVEKYIDSAGKLWETKFGKTPFLVAKFEKDTMPDWMWNAIQKRVYKGFSIGGKAFKKVKGTIYVKSWLETSVVDVPSATGAFFTVLKAACIGPDCPHKQAQKSTITTPILDKFIHDNRETHMKIEKFVQVADDFLKGGPGSGQKGHTTADTKKKLNVLRDKRDREDVLAQKDIVEGQKMIDKAEKDSDVIFEEILALGAKGTKAQYAATTKKKEMIQRQEEAGWDLRLKGQDRQKEIGEIYHNAIMKIIYPNN